MPELVLRNGYRIFLAPVGLLTVRGPPLYHMLQILFSFMVENNFVCFFSFFFFEHVAQISIALGRHTLPHIRTK